VLEGCGPRRETAGRRESKPRCCRRLAKGADSTQNAVPTLFALFTIGCAAKGPKNLTRYAILELCLFGIMFS